MAITQNTYTGNGSTVLYSFTFPYLDQSDIKVRLNGTLTTAYTLANATTIQFNTAPTNGAAIVVYRDTANTALVAEFFPGSAIRAQDLNNDLTQGLYIAQESRNTADSATTTATAATTTANTALSNSTAAVSTANTASSNASAAVSTANTASTNASNAVSTANAANSTSNTANTNANAAVATANAATATAASAVSTANSAVSTANTASSTASAAVSTANTASTNASAAVSTANAANSTASTASGNASTAVTTANNAVTTANTANSNSSAAVTTANAAAAAVANSVLYTTVVNVAAIPGSPANNAAVEITNSTGIESFTPLSGLPSGFVGSSGLSVRIIYQTAGSTWTWIQYFPNDPEARYLKLAGGIVTGNLEIGTTGSLTFEGSTADAFETTVAVVDPTADRTITLPNVTGTVVTTGDTGSVTSTMILDGTILNADVNASAAIAGTKISPDFGTQSVVSGAGTATANGIQVGTGTTYKPGIYSPGADQLAISTAGSGRLFVDASGRLLLGTQTEGEATGDDLTIATTGHTGITIRSGTANYGNIFFSDGTTGNDEFRGSLQYNHAANFLTIGTNAAERLRLDSSGRLGIGTSAPSSQFDVRGSAVDFDAARFLNTNASSGDATSSAIRLGITNSIGQRYARIQATEQDANNNSVNLDFYTNSSSSPTGETIKMRIDGSGNVGIGNTAPSNLLQVGATSAGGNIAITSSSSGSNGFLRLIGPDGNEKLQIYSETAAAGFYTPASTPLIFFVSNQERGRWDTSGRLLVGTSTARSGWSNTTIGSNFLQIERAVTGGDAAISICSNSVNAAGSGTVFLGKTRGASLGLSTIVVSGDQVGQISFQGADGTQLVEAARIDAAVDGTPGANDMPGRLVFSTTADGASSPTERMRITNDGSLFLYTLSGSVSAMAGIKYDTSTKEVYYDTSSRLAKENIADLKHGLDAVKAIQPRTYTAIGGDPNQEIIGFIADELVSVVPEAVFSGAKSAITGNDEDTEIVPLGISYDSLIPVLVKALQEAMERIETLEADVAQLKGA